MHQTHVSVLLPVRNAARFLPRCLQSLSIQTLETFEVLAVDDGSDDQGETLGVLRRYAARDSRVRVIPSQHVGIADALNLAAAHATGEYLARMDADDICHPERLALQSAWLDRRPEIDVVGCLVRFGGDEAASAGYLRHVEWVNSLHTHEQMSLGRFRDAPLAHPSVMFRAASFRRLGGYRQGPFPEDYELWLRWLDAGARFGKIPQILLTWSDPPGRLSRTDPRYSQEAFHRLKAGHLAAWLERHNPLHPDVWVVGAGRVTRRRVDFLRSCGVRVAAYLDIDPAKIGNRHHGSPVLHHEALPGRGDAFVVSYVTTPGAPEHVEAFLAARGYLPGQDYILAG